jgi:hypothetical protein
MSDSIDISGLDRAEILEALHAQATPMPEAVAAVGRIKNAKLCEPLQSKEARALLNKKTGFRVLGGRVLKVELDRDVLDPSGYDQYHGDGAAAQAIAELRVVAPKHERLPDDGLYEVTLCEWSRVGQPNSHRGVSIQCALTYGGRTYRYLGLGATRRVMAAGYWLLPGKDLDVISAGVLQAAGNAVNDPANRATLAAWHLNDGPEPGELRGRHVVNFQSRTAINRDLTKREFWKDQIAQPNRNWIDFLVEAKLGLSPRSAYRFDIYTSTIDYWVYRDPWVQGWERAINPRLGDGRLSPVEFAKERWRQLHARGIAPGRIDPTNNHDLRPDWGGEMDRTWKTIFHALAEDVLGPEDPHG